MVELTIDGKKVEVQEGSMVMHAAHKLGVYVPHFCYHKKLSIAANCRMCLVEVEKAPKAMPACATPATNGMAHTAKAARWSLPEQTPPGLASPSSASTWPWPGQRRGVAAGTGMRADMEGRHA